MGKTIFIDISKYIDDLEKGLITQSTIMEIEGVSKGTLNNAINNYYQEKGLEKPNFRNVSHIIRIDISPYISDLKKGKITIGEIAKIEDVGRYIVKRSIEEYYQEKGIEKIEYRQFSRKKEIDISKYIKDWEKGNLTFAKIAEMEDVSTTVVNRSINEYYQEKGLEKPNKSIIKVKNIDLSLYINDLENGEITPNEIAEIEKMAISTVNKRIMEYYSQKKMPVPDFKIKKKKIVEEEKPIIVDKRKKETNIEQYIEDFENGNITREEIAEIENVKPVTIYKRVEKYYLKQGRKVPKIGAQINELAILLRSGVSIEEIREGAKKRNTLLPDKYFEKAKELLKNADEIDLEEESLEK
ncbi:MAG: hypothetical protein IKG42_03760 [Clostridia bacterium]|nr:hypothetical protein [Clostridia bacterium]